MRKALTIAGSDSGGCAGIQADIKTMSACGVFAMSAITAVTSQNTLGVTHIEEMSSYSVESQIDAVLSDIGADAIKSGMLFSENIIKAVAVSLKKYEVKNYVLDPVMVASSGARLLKDDAVSALIAMLFPLALIVTPNMPEAEALSGIKITSVKDAEKACRIIKKTGAGAVLIKGGHFKGETSDDILFDGENFRTYSSKRITMKNTHGTGCTYSAAIASFLALGVNIYDAIEHAKKYITSAIEHGANMNIGKGSGPVDHFFAMKD